MREVPIVTPAFPEPVASLVYTNWGPRRSLHRFLCLGFPEANSLHVPSTSPTHTSKRRLKDRCVGSGERGRVGGGRRSEGRRGREGPRHLLHPDLVSATTSRGCHFGASHPPARQRAIAASLRVRLPQDDVRPLDLRDNRATLRRRAPPAAGLFPLPQMPQLWPLERVVSRPARRRGATDPRPAHPP